ncbi:MAG: VCBS repeat-containing protein [Bacteroidota bacterium]
MNFRITLCYLFVLLPLLPFAQDFQRLDVPFFNEGVEQNLALVGGLSTPRISNVDLNNDGLLDVYVLDKYGNVQLTFLSDGTQYHFRPEYLAHFPVLKDWVLLRDYNQDGIMDIFAASNSGTPGTAGIEVHTGYYENQMLKFNKAYFPDKPFDMLHMNNTVGQVYSSIVDIPAIDDIDCDGDLDIISFGVGGGRASFFQNQSVEAGYGLDSLIFNFIKISPTDFL